MAFGSLLGALSRVLPGYMEGNRQAVQDNWRDLNQYNQVQAGQQANAWTEAVWQPRLDMMYDSAWNSKINATGNLMDLGTKFAYWPASIYQGQAISQMAPWTAPIQAQLQYGMLGQAMRNLNNPQMWPYYMNMMNQQFPMGPGGGATTPSYFGG